MVDKVYITADGMLRDTWRLASAVRASGWRPDWLVALWRGGAAPGAAVHEFLKTTGWDVRHVPLKCASYTGIGASSGEVKFTLGDETFALFAPGERVLVVDDVFETGVTAEAVMRRLAAAGAEARFAAVYWKRGRNATAVEPDYFARDPGDEWIVFPHEIDGLSDAEVARKDPALAELVAKARTGA